MNKDPLSIEFLESIFRTSDQDDTVIINREGTTKEFKKSYNNGNMAQYFKTMAAFANNEGGYIFFGIDDKPRRLLGLTEKSLNQFENLKVEDLTKKLLEYFSPEIKWDHCTFPFHKMNFGVIYVYSLKNKPCICKKNYDDASNKKYSLMEGHIYYRYGGRSERIHFEELNAIIDESRKNEEQQWINFIQKAARIGASNAALLDLNNGNLTGNGTTIVLDEDLLEKIVFVQEGKFVETNGKPTLRLIGDVEDISTGKIVVTKSSKKIIRAIEPGDIVRAFLLNKNVEEPLEYLKGICLSSSAYFPLYFFLKQDKKSVKDAILFVKGINCRGGVKQRLILRLQGHSVEQKKIPNSNQMATKKKKEYLKLWLDEDLPEIIDDIGYCVEALLYLTDQEIKDHQKYIKEILLKIFDNEYESATTNLASKIRNAICRIDESLNLECIEN